MIPLGRLWDGGAPPARWASATTSGTEETEVGVSGIGDTAAVGGSRPGRDAQTAGRHGAPPPDTAGATPERLGYRGPVACTAAGITYRQLDYWARTGLVEPSVRPARGSGTQRLYSFRDILVLKIVKRLLDTGVSLQNIRTAVGHLRAGGVSDLAQITLMSDGASVYQCTSPDEVVDLLQGGQGVFGIAVGAVWREVKGALSRLHAEQVDAGEPAVEVSHTDELARRRRARVG